MNDMNMQTREKYEKPEMKFEDMKLSDNVLADECWTSHKSDTMYLDTPGPGYIKFKASGNGNGCGNPAISVQEYINYPKDTVHPSIDEYLTQYVGTADGKAYTAHGKIHVGSKGNGWS